MTTTTESTPGSTETAGSTPAAADIGSAAAIATAAPGAPTEATALMPGAERRLSEILDSSINEILGPTLDAWTAVRDACDEHDDDAALGRGVRTIVQTWATTTIDKAIAR